MDWVRGLVRVVALASREEWDWLWAGVEMHGSGRLWRRPRAGVGKKAELFQAFAWAGEG